MASPRAPWPAALLGAAGGLLLGGAPEDARLVVLAGALLGAIALDLRPGAAPGPRRQVNERWLDQYRGWVYGLGYGAQLGVGVSTVVTSAATYVALLAAFLAAGAGPRRADHGWVRRDPRADAAAGRARAHRRAAAGAARPARRGLAARPRARAWLVLGVALILALAGSLA